jgi:hypothetical protein
MPANPHPASHKNARRVPDASVDDGSGWMFIEGEKIEVEQLL